MDHLPAIALLITIAAITPGPNNFIVMTAATHGGWRIIAPAIAGVLAGGQVLLMLIWFGMGAIFTNFPQAQSILLVAGVLYLLWLGGVLIWQSNRQKSDFANKTHPAPTTALHIALFQLLNTKSWVLILTATTAMMKIDNSELALITLTATLICISTLCLGLWAGTGLILAKWLENPIAQRRFDRIMGLLLMTSAALLLF